MGLDDGSLPDPGEDAALDGVHTLGAVSHFLVALWLVVVLVVLLKRRAIALLRRCFDRVGRRRYQPIKSK
jgi:hypothetical protein